MLVKHIVWGFGQANPEPCINFPEFGWGDPDCDGSIVSLDVLKMMLYLADLPYTQNDPCPDIGEAYP